MRKFNVVWVVMLLCAVITNFVFAKNLATFPELAKPASLLIAEDRIFIPDETTIYIYSLKDFKLVKKFGKRGEGPQEFMLNPILGELVIDVLPDTIVVNSMGKISLFSKEGDFKRSVKVRTMSTDFKTIGSGFVGNLIASENGIFYVTVNIFDSTLEKQKEICKQKLATQPGKEINPTVSRGPLFYVVEDNKIFVDTEAGAIDVLDKNGEKLYSITHDYEKIKVTEDHKQKYKDFFKNDPSTKMYYTMMEKLIKFPEYFPAVRYFHVIGNKVYVLTFKEKDQKREFIIFDLKGKLLKKTMLPLQELSAIKLNPYTFKDMKFYQLVENKDETWELQELVIH